jgi:acyl-coenzyme A thioesterase 7
MCNIGSIPEQYRDAGDQVLASTVKLSQLIQPSHCTTGGLVLGGVLMKLMDNAAAIVAVSLCIFISLQARMKIISYLSLCVYIGLLRQFRHCKTNAVTACVEAVDFISPTFLGDVVVVSATPTFTSNRSIEVELRVECESLTSKDKKLTCR